MNTDQQENIIVRNNVIKRNGTQHVVLFDKYFSIFCISTEMK